MGGINVDIEASWKKELSEEFEKSYFIALVTFLKKEKQKGKTIYPPGPLIFNAYNLCPFEDVKVVIIGQDPYHGPGQAMGLCFSVPKAMRTPPSLVNIYKEIQHDLGLPIPDHGDLTSWARSGVFLLNSVLTVESGKAASHAQKGWEQFTDATIMALSERGEHIVFMLWGNYAKKKASLIDSKRHLVLTAAHPSPLARNAFFGNKHFSKANAYLSQHNKKPISWEVK